MKNANSHVYLYAKNHYKRSDNIIDDLKRIYADRNLGSVEQAEHISISNIISCLLNLAFKHMKINEYLFSQFINDISPDKWHYWKYVCASLAYATKIDYDFNLAVIGKCLSIIMLTDLKDIPEGLDEPDPKILPLTKE
jgi:hypothetical protein